VGRTCSLRDRILVVDVPLVAFDQRLGLIVFRLPAEDFLSLFYGDEAVLVSRAVDPLVERRKVKLFQDDERRDDEPDRRVEHFRTAFRVFAECADVIVFSEVADRADVEDVVPVLTFVGHRKVDRVAEIIDFEELITVFAVSDERDLVALFDPVVEDLENAETVGPDEGLRAYRRDVKPLFAVFVAVLFKRDLAFAVVADSDKFVVFEERMVIRNAVDSGRRDDDDPLFVFVAEFEDVLSAVNVCREDLLACRQWKCRSGVDDAVGLCDQLIHFRRVADIAVDHFRRFVVILRMKLSDVEKSDFAAHRNTLFFNVQP